MNHAQCGEVKPVMHFGPATGPKIRCTKKLGHAWDHCCETLPGDPSWPQVEIISADDLAKLTAAVKNPLYWSEVTAFKSLGCVVVHCRCKELDP